MQLGRLLPRPTDLLRSLWAYPAERVLRLLKKSAHDTTSGCCLSSALRRRSVMPPQMPYSTLLSSASAPHSRITGQYRQITAALRCAAPCTNSSSGSLSLHSAFETQARSSEATARRLLLAATRFNRRAAGRVSDNELFPSSSPQACISPPNTDPMMSFVIFETFMYRDRPITDPLAVTSKVEPGDRAHIVTGHQRCIASLCGRHEKGAVTTRSTLTVWGHGRFTARLVVRRFKDARYSVALFPVWRYHPFFTNFDLPITEADITHRKHAIIETTFADLDRRHR
jgi:hypothetical protein